MFQVKNAIQALQELATTSSNVRHPYSLPARSNPDLPDNMKRPHTAMLQRSSSHPPEVFGWDGPYDSPTHRGQSYHNNTYHQHQQYQHQQYVQQYQYQQHHYQPTQQQQQQQQQPQNQQQLQLRYYHRKSSVVSTADAAVQTDVSGVDVFERFVKTHRQVAFEWLNESDHVAVTVYDDGSRETVIDDDHGAGTDADGSSGPTATAVTTAADGRRNEQRSPSSSTCSSPRDEHRSSASSAVAVAEEPPAVLTRDWYPRAATTGESGGDGDECATGVGGNNYSESIEMTNMTPAAAAVTGTKNIKFRPFV